MPHNNHLSEAWVQVTVEVLPDGIHFLSLYLAYKVKPSTPTHLSLVRFIITNFFAKTLENTPQLIPLTIFDNSLFFYFISVL